MTTHNEIFWDNIQIDGWSGATVQTVQAKYSVILQKEIEGKYLIKIVKEIQGKYSISAPVSKNLQGAYSILSEHSLLVSTQVNCGLTDVMYRATLAFDKDMQDLLETKIVVTIPDYNGIQQKVFVGYIASLDGNNAAVGSDSSVVAYDYAYFLTMNYLKLSDQVLLSLDEQATTFQYRLNYDFCTNPRLNFAEGQIVWGGTTGHGGKIIENHFSGYMGNGYLILEMVSGLPVAGHYFQDDETLLVDGVVYAYTDGFTMDVTSIWTTYYPDDWVRRILGGDDWETTTGIYPYRLANTAPLWDVVQITIQFEELTTLIQALQKVAKYLNYIVYTRWKDLDVGINTPCLYFIPETEIDFQISNGDPHDGLDLPAMVTIAASSPCLISPNKYTFKGAEKYNRITVRCQGLDGVWHNKTMETDALIYKHELPRHFKEINPDISTQAECDTRCTYLYTYKTDFIKSWDITLIERSDLRLLQLIEFSGYSTQIPDGDYRIINISYNYANAGLINEVTCTVIPVAQFNAYLDVSRTFTDTISEIQAITRDEINKMGSDEAGTILSVDGTTITVQTEAGVIKVARDAS